MADRGRDLKIGILSDASKFDLSDPAEQLEDVGKNASQAEDELKRLAAQGKDAQRELDRMADTGEKVDDAFERIAKSSRASMRGVDDGLDGSKEGLQEFRDEADSTAKEAAASFTDVESGLDAIQEIAANAFAGFGPAGKAAGIAAAVGIGLLFKGLQDASDKANEVKDRVISMAQSASEAGGTMSYSGIAETIREWGYAIGDNKSWWEVWQKANTTNIEMVAQRAQDLGLTFKDLFRGMSGSDPQAALRVMEEIDAQIAAIDRSQAEAARTRTAGTRDFVDAEKIKRHALSETRDEVEAALGMSEETARLLALETEALERNAQAESDRQDALSETVGILEEIGAVEAERADGTVKSIDEIIKAQEKEIQAKRDFLTNTKEVLDEVGQAGVEWANSFGPLAPKMMQMLADAPKDKQAEIIANHTQIGVLAGEGTAAGVVSQSGTVANAAVSVHQKAAAAVEAAGLIGIKLGLAGQDIPYAVRLAIAEAQAYADRHPVVIKTKIPNGQKPLKDVP